MNDECEHEWVRAGGVATKFFPARCAFDHCVKCGVPWADAVRGFGSNVQQLSGKVKRVVRA